MRSSITLFMELSLLQLFVIFLVFAAVFTWVLSKLPHRFRPNYHLDLVAARKKKGLTRSALAHLVGIDEVFLEDIEKGKKHPSNKIAQMFEKHLDVIVLRINAFYVLTLLKTTHTTLFDRFAHHTKIVNFMADMGLVLGFGTIAIDYMRARGKSKPIRIGMVVLSFVLLYLFFNIFLLGILENPFIAQYNEILAISFAIGGFAGFLVVSLLAYGVFIVQSLLIGEQVCPGIAPLIPGVEIPNVPIVLPLHAWISFVIILIVHEGMHGVLARKNLYRVKSAGLLLLGFLPIGAFVEPDEAQIRKGDEKEAVRIFAAGPAGNLFTMLLVLVAIIGFIFLIFNPFISPWQNQIFSEGISHFAVANVQETVGLCGKEYAGPAFGLLVGGSKVVSVNGDPVEIGKPLNIERGQSVSLVVEEGGIPQEKTITPTEVGHLGFALEPVWEEGYTIPQDFENYRAVRNAAASFFFWLIILNFLVGVVNFLPIEPFDGGKIAKPLLLPYFAFLNMPKDDTERLIGRVLLWIVAIIMLVNALPLFL
jgi:membrane-associated protease RseP (regulator of RpoE activity)/DNA-binding XRE family transcriptional regulator